MNRLRRSMLFLPGANAAMLSTAFIYRPDSIMFDLEDAVAQGAFGVPFYITGDERFWGQDHIEDLDLHLSGTL